MVQIPARLPHSHNILIQSTFVILLIICLSFSGCLDAQQYPVDTKTGPGQNFPTNVTTRSFANPIADVGTFGISALLLHGSRSIAPMHAMNEIWAEEPAPCGRSLDEATAIVAESEAQDEVRFDTGAKIKIQRIFLIGGDGTEHQ